MNFYELWEYFKARIIFVLLILVIMVFSLLIYLWMRPTCEDKIAKFESNKKSSGIHAPRFIAIRQRCQKSSLH